MSINGVSVSACDFGNKYLQGLVSYFFAQNLNHLRGSTGDMNLDMRIVRECIISHAYRRARILEILGPTVVKK